ncbi:MAG: class I SAM-dependent methyltransferase [Phycisphaerae bacterium]|nr:class I SAM-dependent methyltransferase [Phycisphaerae bacterium]MDD5381435.1 class I SAM-dependent methyltransferase [Phycisphaerae bacterium]
MHTKISPDNPYGYDRWGFAWEHVPAGPAAHLDFGCGKGHLLNGLNRKKAGRLVGVDASEEQVEQGRKLFPDLEIVKIHKDAPLPFDDATFGSVTIMDVLEHIYEQAKLLTELNRVLIDGGKLIVTVPGQHLFSVFDVGNLKFRFPKLHRWYYCLRHSPVEYERRYVSNPEGLIGDVSAMKRWHEHFSRDKLRKLLTEAGFSVIDFDGAGFFSRVIGNINYLLKRLKLVHKALSNLRNLDCRLFESTNLFCIAEKCRTGKIVN